MIEYVKDNAQDVLKNIKEVKVMDEKDEEKLTKTVNDYKDTLDYLIK